MSGVFAATVLLTVFAALSASLVDVHHLMARAPWLVALAVFGATAGVAAIAPGASAARMAAGAIGVGLMAALVISRGSGVSSTTPGWICSVSHFGLDLLPLGAALAALRQAAWQRSRAIVAGLGVGAAGAALGELACHQGAVHVLVHHIGAWLLAALTCVVIARRLRPRTFAP
jgi:hypothetical protein